MQKRIILCCDGTWSEPEDVKNDRIVPTNVLKTVRAVSPYDTTTDTDQVVFYDQGVGTGTVGLIDKYLGGGTGVGISKNILDCYRFLCNNYAEGDTIFCFGYSRGAYTVRSLSGMLDAVGLLEKADMEYASAAYAYYRTKPKERTQSKYHAILQNLPRVTPKIKFMGVWDTVGALGVPTPLLSKLSRFWIGYHNTALSTLIENAYQATAIDERRRPFQPALWDERSGQANVQQVWFAGVHSNIGGSSRDSGLSDLAFEWMINRAKESGLAIDERYMNDRDKVACDPKGKMSNSFSMGYKLLAKLGMAPYERPVGSVSQVGEMIHESAVERLKDAELDYRPPNVIPSGATPDQLIAEHGGRSTLDVHDVKLPIFRERQAVRRPLSNISGTLSLDGETQSACEILDHHDNGACLKVATPMPPGETGTLESDYTGRHDVTVIWRQENVIGVQFAA